MWSCGVMNGSAEEWECQSGACRRWGVEMAFTLESYDSVSPCSSLTLLEAALTYSRAFQERLPRPADSSAVRELGRVGPQGVGMLGLVDLQWKDSPKATLFSLCMCVSNIP